jgi:hypothetical protein
MPSSTLDAPLEALKYNGVTLITTVENRAYLERVTSPDDFKKADSEMCAFFSPFLSPRLF